MADTPIRCALISVSDKSGIVGFASELAGRGIALLSTGGTLRTLREAGIEATEVADHTGFPEMMDGRVKTLHPMIHGGILALRDKAEHSAAMQQHGIAPIDLVVVNLYPFEETVAAGAEPATVIENIDIGGPALIRAAAKNHGHVGVVTEVEDYAGVLDALADNDGALPEELRRSLAAKAYAHTAAYDAAVAAWFEGYAGHRQGRRFAAGGRRLQTLRYGENPHQQAAFYAAAPPRPGVATAEQVHGKELSYNNINDTDAAFELVAEFDTAAVVIVKHANPCGVATGENLAGAYHRAFACDPLSAFGGIIAANRPLDGEAADAIGGQFAEVVIAPDFTPEALEKLSRKKNLRLLRSGGMPDPAAPGVSVRRVAGGLLVQDRDNGRIAASDLRVVTKRAPSEDEIADLIFAFRVCKHVKSNAIVYAKHGATVGIGAGQMSRVDSSRIAAWKAGEAASAAGLDEPLTKGSVVASDAFFPFADGLIAAVEAGATAIIQPGGSIRDDEVIAAADEAGLAMVFTGMRHFRH